MDCREAEMLMQDEIDGVLSRDREAQLRAHVDGCAACSRTRQELNRLASAVSRLQDTPLPDGTWNRLLSHALAQHQSPRSRRYWHTVPAALAAAAVLLLAVWWYGQTGANRRTSREPQASAVTRRVVDDAAFSGAVAHADIPSRDTGSPQAEAPLPPDRTTPAPPTPSRPPRVRPASGRSSAPPAPPPSHQEAAKASAVQLTGNDLYIYEKALEFAARPGSSEAPTEALFAARTRAASGDIDDAIRNYEQAVSDSIRSPIPPPPARAAGTQMGATTIFPLPPPELVAQTSWLADPTAPIRANISREEGPNTSLLPFAGEVSGPNSRREAPRLARMPHSPPPAGLPDGR